MAKRIVAEILDDRGEVIRRTRLGPGFTNLWTLRGINPQIDTCNDDFARVQPYANGRGELIIVRGQEEVKITSFDQIPAAGMSSTVLSPAGTSFNLRFRKIPSG